MESYEKRTWWSRHRLTERLVDESYRKAAFNEVVDKVIAELRG